MLRSVMLLPFEATARSSGNLAAQGTPIGGSSKKGQKSTSKLSHRRGELTLSVAYAAKDATPEHEPTVNTLRAREARA